MALSINTNIPSLQADRQLAKKTDALKKNFEKISSGLRINHASDDAAGLSIGTSLLTDARIDDVGTRNISDAVSAADIAEGAIGSATDIVTRLGELSQQAANGTLSATQRSALNNEFQALRTELDRIATTTEFNGQQLLNGNSSVAVQAGDDGSSSSQLSIAFPGVSASALGLASDISTQANAEASLDSAKTAIGSLAQARGGIGASVSRLDTAFENLRSSSTNARDAASQILDEDIASSAANLTANRIQQQAAAAVKAQANIQPQIALKLLGA